MIRTLKGLLVTLNISNLIFDTCRTQLITFSIINFMTHRKNTSVNFISRGFDEELNLTLYPKLVFDAV